MGVMKGFISPVLHICSEKYLAHEIKFSINLFVKSGHSITVLERVTQEYMNNIISISVDTIKVDKIAKLS